MAASSTARCLHRLAIPKTPHSPFNHLHTPSTKASHLSNRLLSQPLQRTSRRAYSSEPPQQTPFGRYIAIGGLAVAGGAGYYIYATGNQGALKVDFFGESSSKGKIKETESAPSREPAVKPAAQPVTKRTQQDYQAVYNDIASRLDEKDDYDDGSYGPVLLRLAWHCSGTYDKATNTGGSNGATMRFDPEADHGANAGLKAARDFMEPVKEKHPWISYSDLWTLGGVAAIQEMQGPIVPWRPGREDRTITFCTPDGRLPDGSKEQSHLRAIFQRMGFNDQEIVALSGAHALGRCHTDRSGFEGPWTLSPTVVTNDYYKLLMDEKWGWRQWNGPKQYQDTSKTLMMLPTDMALVKDGEFKKHVERYAKSNEVFFDEFSKVLTKLFELGVPFTVGEDARMSFKSSYTS